MRLLTWKVAVLAVAAACALPAAAQTVYRWVDSDGKVQFSDTPPPQSAKDVTQKRVTTGTVEVSQLPYATQMAMKKSPVTLYTATSCGDPCTLGRALRSDRGIPYAERDAQGNPTDTEAVKRLVGALQVPVLVIGSDPIKGYSESGWHAALDGAGYPRTKLPGTLAPKPVAPVVRPTPPPPPPAPPAEEPDDPAAAKKP